MPDFGRWGSNGGDPSLNEINRADRFFEALASKQPVFSTDPAEAELAFLFSEFRDDVRDAPVTAPVSARDAVEALRGGLAKNRGTRRGFAIVGSVAAAILCIGGFGAGVYGAGPGDSLYGMRTAIFGQQEQTRDDQVSLAAAQLQQVQQLIDQGQWEQAQDKLVQVSSAVQGVDRVENKQQLVEQWNALTYKVIEQDPAATLTPGEPLPVLPSSPLTWLPVPVVEAPTSETATSETATSESSVTSDPSSSPVPPGTLITAPPDSLTPATTPTTATSASPTPVSTSVSTSSSTSTPPPSSTPPASAGPPRSRPTAATGTVPATPPGATSSTSAVPRLIPPTSTIAELPASPPLVAPSSTVAAPPPVPAPSSASVAPNQPAPTTTTTTMTTTPEPPSVTPTTTVPPYFGGVS